MTLLVFSYHPIIFLIEQRTTTRKTMENYTLEEVIDVLQSIKMKSQETDVLVGKMYAISKILEENKVIKSKTKEDIISEIHKEKEVIISKTKKMMAGIEHLKKEVCDTSFETNSIKNYLLSNLHTLNYAIKVHYRKINDFDLENNLKLNRKIQYIQDLWKGVNNDTVDNNGTVGNNDTVDNNDIDNDVVCYEDESYYDDSNVEEDDSFYDDFDDNKDRKKGKSVCYYGKTCRNMNKGCNRIHSNKRKCRYGNNCKRKKTCIYVHEVDNGDNVINDSDYDIEKRLTVCRHGKHCTMRNCEYAHLDGRYKFDFSDDISEIKCRFYESGTCMISSCPFKHKDGHDRKNVKIPCKYGYDCIYYPDCKYYHGKDV